MTSLSKMPAAITRVYVTGISHPIVASEFREGRGLVAQGWRKRITASWARKLRGQGVADFQTSELAG